MPRSGPFDGTDAAGGPADPRQADHGGGSAECPTAAPAVPQWLEENLSRTPRIETVAVGELEVACSIWDPSEGTTASGPDVLLLHGNGAQRTWWDAIAPSLARRSRVVAMDFGGSGDSGRRDEYTLDGYVDEVLGVCAAIGLDRPVVAGHSMGGLVAVASSWRDPQAFSGVVVLDTPLRRFTREQLRKRTAIGLRPLTAHPTRADAIAHFRTVPGTLHRPEGLFEHIAARAFRLDGAGWVLKLDPRTYLRVTDVDEFSRPFPPRTLWVRAEHGLITDEMAGQLAELLAPGAGRLIEVPGVSHNLILEAPLAVAWVLRLALEGVFFPVEGRSETRDPVGGGSEKEAR